MKCIRIIGLKKDLQKVVESLHKIGLLHLKKTEYKPLSDSEFLSKHEQVSRYLVKVRGFLNVLPPVPCNETTGYTLESALKTAESLEFLEPELKQLTQDISKLDSQLAKTLETYTKLKPYEGFAFDFSAVEKSGMLEARVFHSKKPELLRAPLAEKSGYAEVIEFPGNLTLVVTKSGLEFELPEGTQQIELPRDVPSIAHELRELEKKREELEGFLTDSFEGRSMDGPGTLP